MHAFYRGLVAEIPVDQMHALPRFWLLPDPVDFPSGSTPLDNVTTFDIADIVQTIPDVLRLFSYSNQVMFHQIKALSIRLSIRSDDFTPQYQYQVCAPLPRLADMKLQLAYLEPGVCIHYNAIAPLFTNLKSLTITPEFWFPAILDLNIIPVPLKRLESLSVDLSGMCSLLFNRSHDDIVDLRLSEHVPNLTRLVVDFFFDRLVFDRDHFSRPHVDTALHWFTEKVSQRIPVFESTVWLEGRGFIHPLRPLFVRKIKLGLGPPETDTVNIPCFLETQRLHGCDRTLEFSLHFNNLNPPIIGFLGTLFSTNFFGFSQLKTVVLPTIIMSSWIKMHISNPHITPLVQHCVIPSVTKLHFSCGNKPAWISDQVASIRSIFIPVQFFQTFFTHFPRIRTLIMGPDRRACASKKLACLSAESAMLEKLIIFLHKLPAFPNFVPALPQHLDSLLLYLEEFSWAGNRLMHSLGKNPNLRHLCVCVETEFLDEEARCLFLEGAVLIASSWGQRPWKSIVLISRMRGDTRCTVVDRTPRGYSQRYMKEFEWPKDLWVEIPDLASLFWDELFEELGRPTSSSQ